MPSWAPRPARARRRTLLPSLGHSPLFLLVLPLCCHCLAATTNLGTAAGYRPSSSTTTTITTTITSLAFATRSSFPSSSFLRYNSGRSPTRRSLAAGLSFPLLPHPPLLLFSTPCSSSSTDSSNTSKEEDAPPPSPPHGDTNSVPYVASPSIIDRLLSLRQVQQAAALLPSSSSSSSSSSSAPSFIDNTDKDKEQQQQQQRRLGAALGIRSGLGFQGGGALGGGHEGVFVPSTGSLFLPGFDPQAEMEGLGAYFCSGVKKRAAEERPVVTIKLAIDQNGAVDDKTLKPARFTCDSSLDAVHRLRRDAEAVLVGVETVVRDNPSLTVRRIPLRPDQRQPIRVVLDRSLRIPYSSTILNDRHRTLVYYVQGPWRHMRAADIMLAKFGSPVLIDCIYESELSPNDAAPLQEILGRLYDMGVRKHVMVEGGPRTAKAFLDAACADRAVIYQAPIVFNGEPVMSGIQDEALEKAGLAYLGSYPSGVDTVHCWSRPSIPWPTEELSAWP